MLDLSQMFRTPNILEPSRDLNRFSICKLHFKNHCQELRWFVIGLQINIYVQFTEPSCPIHRTYIQFKTQFYLVKLNMSNSPNFTLYKNENITVPWVESDYNSSLNDTFKKGLKTMNGNSTYMRWVNMQLRSQYWKCMLNLYMKTSLIHVINVIIRQT